MEQLEVLTAVLLGWDHKDRIPPLAAFTGCERAIKLKEEEERDLTENAL